MDSTAPSSGSSAGSSGASGNRVELGRSRTSSRSASGVSSDLEPRPGTPARSPISLLAPGSGRSRSKGTRPGPDSPVDECSVLEIGLSTAERSSPRVGDGAETCSTDPGDGVERRDDGDVGRRSIVGSVVGADAVSDSARSSERSSLGTAPGEITSGAEDRSTGGNGNVTRRATGTGSRFASDPWYAHGRAPGSEELAGDNR